MSDLPQIGPAEPVAVLASDNPTNDGQVFVGRPFTPLIEYLGVGDPDSKIASQLNEIWQYLGEKVDSEETTDRMKFLKSLEDNLSPPKLGQSRLYNIYGYVQAQRAIQKAEQWRDSFYRKIEE